MEKCGHYERWRDDLQLVRDLGLHYLRWGPALPRTFIGPAKYNWDWCDEVLAAMGWLDIAPIMDLCHFGVPEWLGNFQNEDFPAYFAEYAAACAARYSHIKYWTPVNEILITTLFSAKYGWWNEMLTSEEAYVRATINTCKANLLAMQAILQSVPDAIFIQSESSEYAQPAHPNLVDRARFSHVR